MTVNVVKLFVLLITIQCGGAEFLTPSELSEMEESFVKAGTEYLMLNARVTWNEAEIICASYKNASMAIVNSDDKAEFLGEALAETNMELEDLWVGARAQIGIDGYVWINHGGVYVPDKYFIKRGHENFENISRECLAFARQFHDIAHFINLECDLKRVFICERPYVKTNNGSMTTPNWITVGKYKYAIFYDRKTWRQSVRECRRRHKAHLASFRNNKEVVTLGKFLLIGRPSFENAWIGGHFRNNSWRFIIDNVPLKEKVNETTLFPPWRQDRPLKHAGCLLLDRHFANHPVFLEAHCERLRSYICSKEIDEIPDYSVVVINGTRYTIFYIKKGWEEAWVQCQSINASLIKVTKEIIHDVTYMMSENVTGINHIWIGGRLSKYADYFYWVIDNEPIPQNNINPNYYPPWFDNEYDEAFACLNMDRENHNRPLFYGAECDTPQQFICESPDGQQTTSTSTTTTTTEKPPPTRTV